jgi:hypothetical protein
MKKNFLFWSDEKNREDANPRYFQLGGSIGNIVLEKCKQNFLKNIKYKDAVLMSCFGSEVSMKLVPIYSTNLNNLFGLRKVSLFEPKNPIEEYIINSNKIISINKLFYLELLNGNQTNISFNYNNNWVDFYNKIFRYKNFNYTVNELYIILKTSNLNFDFNSIKQKIETAVGHISENINFKLGFEEAPVSLKNYQQEEIFKYFEDNYEKTNFKI